VLRWSRLKQAVKKACPGRRRYAPLVSEEVVVVDEKTATMKATPEQQYPYAHSYPQQQQYQQQQQLQYCEQHQRYYIPQPPQQQPQHPPSQPPTQNQQKQKQKRRKRAKDAFCKLWVDLFVDGVGSVHAVYVSVGDVAVLAELDPRSFQQQETVARPHTAAERGRRRRSRRRGEEAAAYGHVPQKEVY
jgi:hypothetical protein